MTGTSPSPRMTTAGAAGGALLAAAGALVLLQQAVGGWGALSTGASVALAAGALLLALGPDGVVGPRPIGRVALAVLGVGPLLEELPLDSVPAPVVLGMTMLVLVTAATVVTAVAVVRAGVLRGIARWAPVPLAVDALLLLLMSSGALGRLPSVFLDWHLDLIRPVLLVTWGLAIVLHGRAAAIRNRAAELDESWKRSTSVGGADDPAPRNRTPA